jgi:hypothetical protein
MESQSTGSGEMPIGSHGGVPGSASHGSSLLNNVLKPLAMPTLTLAWFALTRESRKEAMTMSRLVGWLLPAGNVAALFPVLAEARIVTNHSETLIRDVR